MHKSLNPRGVFCRPPPSRCSMLLAALLLLALSACGTPQPLQLPQAMIYNSSQAGIIYALSAQNGSVRWQYRTVDNVFGTGLTRPTLLNGTIYAATSSGGIFVYALNAQDGAVRWKVKVNETPTPPEQPVIVNNILYLVASRTDSSSVTEVYALRIQDGSVLWHYQAAGYPSTKNVLVANGLVYLTLAGSALSPLLALDAITGAVRWQAHLPGTSNSTPATADGLVIISDSNGQVYALQAATGTLVWNYPLATPSEASTLTATQDLVYVGGANGSVVALRTNDGSERWQVRLADSAFVPVVVQDILYVVSDEGNTPLYALRTSNGTTIWQYQSDEHPCIGRIPVTIADQVLYCTGADYSLLLLDASSGLLMQHYTLPSKLLSSYPVVVGPKE